MTKDFILASGSAQRIALLKQIGFEPALTEPADIDETPFANERPAAYVKRMAIEKARAVARKHPKKVVLSGDTIIVVGCRIVQKSHSSEEQTEVMRLLSGKAHRVMSAVCVIDAAGKETWRLNKTKVQMKKMSESEIAEYVAGREWVGCAGYKIEGCLAGFVRKIIGSYSGVVGLPLFEARNLLVGAGIK